MAQIARCAWCRMHKSDLGRVLVVSKSDDDQAWVGYACMPCYAALGAGSYLQYKPPKTDSMATMDFDDLSDSLKSDVAILRLSPPYKHVQGVGIRVGDYYEVVLLED